MTDTRRGRSGEKAIVTQSEMGFEISYLLILRSRLLFFFQIFHPASAAAVLPFGSYIKPEKIYYSDLLNIGERESVYREKILLSSTKMKWIYQHGLPPSLHGS